MKKTILSLILICSMLAPLSVSAFDTESAPIPEWIINETEANDGMTDEKYNHIYELLKYLGVVDAPAEEINPDEKMTREEAVAIFAKISGNVSDSVDSESFSDVKRTDKYALEIYSALNAGLISNESGRFYPKKYITLKDCGSIALKILGYGIIPEIDEDYYTNDLKLFKKVSENDGALTKGNFYIFLENMLGANPAELKVTEGGYSYEVSVSDNTYLFERKDIQTYTGIVTATEYAAIYNKKDFYEGYIEINNMSFESENKISENMLGKYVNAYVYTGSDRNVVISLAAVEKYNEEIEISFDDFDGISSDKISYYNENSRKRQKLSENAIVVYNGQFGGNLESSLKYFDDFDNVRLLDNNRDGETDIIFIDKKQYAYIESASEASQSMRTGMGDYLDFSEDVCALYRIFDENGEQIDLTKVLTGSVIEYRLAYSYDKKTIYEILISKQKITGILQGSDSENGKIYYNIDGTEYELSEYYEKYLKEDIKDKKPQIGSEAAFYMSADNKIVYSSANVYSYGFILKGYCDTDDNDVCVMTLYTYDGLKKTYNLKEKLKLITPEYPEGRKVEAKIAIEALNDEKGSIKNEVIAFQTDGNDNIKLIATEMDMTGKAPGTVDYPLVKNHVVLPSDTAQNRRIYQELIAFTWYVPSSVKRLTVPTDKSKFDDTKYFSVSSVKGQGGDNNEYLTQEHILYNSDEFYNVGFCITKENKVNFSSDIIEPYLITKVSKSVNEDDEEGVMLEYLSSKGTNSAFVKYDVVMKTYSDSWMPQCSIKDLKAGDVVYIEKDSTDEVSILAVIVKSDKLPARGGYGGDGVTNSNGYFNPFVALGIIHGTVQKTQVATESAIINLSKDGNDSKGDMIFRIGKHGVEFYNYNIYLRENNKFSAVSFSDIMPGDEVVCIKRYNKVTDIYILR